MPADDGLQLEASFETGARGRLFCVRFLPAGGSARAGAVFVHAFAEEMNKGRHVVAHTARALARAGVAVEAVDLHGCGDSEGTLADASIDAWLGDLASRVREMRRRVAGPVHLWGLRAGALLAATYRAADCDAGAEDGLVLWQPALRGRQILTEFLRLRAAASFMTGGAERDTVESLRARLKAGESLEVAGYELTPALAEGLDALALRSTGIGRSRVAWIEVSRDPDGPLSPAARSVVEKWAGDGANVETTRVPGPLFWSAAELEDCPALAPATVGALVESRA